MKNNKNICYFQRRFVKPQPTHGCAQSGNAAQSDASPESRVLQQLRVSCARARRSSSDDRRYSTLSSRQQSVETLAAFRSAAHFQQRYAFIVTSFRIKYDHR